MSTIITDTGPLVAFLNRRDQWHTWARDVFALHEPPFLVCEGVLIEAGFLLHRAGDSADKVMELLHRGLVEVAFRFQDSHHRVRRLLHRYRDLPASMTDICLVCMSEAQRDCRVVTTDSDFRVYRRHERQVIPLIAPPGI